MKASSRTTYALKTLMDLATGRRDKPVPAVEIAQRQDIPPRFLDQILLELKSAGIVRQTSVKSGVYRILLAS